MFQVTGTATSTNCLYNPANKGATLNSVVTTSNYDEIALATTVATIGPVVVAIDASRPSFQSYSGGIYSDSGCTNNTDHAVTVVGYGEIF